jgi:hypothetical protein
VETVGGWSEQCHVDRHVLLMNEVTMKSPEPPSAGRADVRIVAASPEVARQVAEVLRHCFAATEQRSYPVDVKGGTRLHLIVDTTHMPEPARSWLVTSQSSGDAHRQTDEI